MTRQIILALSTMWAARAAGVIANLLLLPVLFHNLPADELGTWLLLGQAGALLGFMDFGIGSVLTRRIAIASAIQAGEGANDRAERLRRLMAAANWLYRLAAVVAFLVGLVVGWIFLGHTGLDPEMRAAGRTAWVMLCLAQAINLWGGLWSASLSGLGHVATMAAIGSVSGLLTLATLAVTVLAGGGIASLAAVMLVSNAIQRWAIRRLVLRREKALCGLGARCDRPVIAALLSTSMRYWMTEIGAVLLLRTDQFFIAGFRNAADIPAYYAGYTLVYHMAMIAMGVGDASSVYLSRAWSEGRIGYVRALVTRGARAGLALILCGVGVMVWIGDAVLAVWLGPGHFVGWPTFLAFCAMLALFVHQSLMFSFSRATEHEIYAPCYIAAGLLNLLFTWFLIERLGLLGVALGTLCAQLLTTNWFVPMRALRRLGIGVRRYAVQVALPAIVAGMITSASVWAATHGIAGQAMLLRVAVGSLAGAAAMGIAFWIVVFDGEMRDEAMRYAALAFRRVRGIAASSSP